jgi:diacylglycerol diphosphate phosphatase/phosphatidate phosphatase
MFLVTIIALPLNASPPIGKRLFPVPTLPGVLSQNSSTPTPDPNSILWAAYPFRASIISVPLSACLAIFPPLVLFTIAQIRLRSYPDLHASWYGLLSTLVLGTFFQVVLKSFVGGLRPYFYDACQPNMAALTRRGGQGWGGVMYGREICTGASRDVNKALTSFPSGHSNAAMGSALFVSLWLNAKLKVFADSRARFWKLFLFL